MKKRKSEKCIDAICENCESCIPIGEGDFSCSQHDYNIVISDYAPADNYLICGGSEFN